MVAGALPKSGIFTSSGGKVLLHVSGSAFSGVSGTIIVNVAVDGTTVGQLRGYTNEASSHKAMVSNSIVVNGLGAATHTVSLSVGANTITDLNDYFDVTAIEFN